MSSPPELADDSKLNQQRLDDLKLAIMTRLAGRKFEDIPQEHQPHMRSEIRTLPFEVDDGDFSLEQALAELALYNTLTGESVTWDDLCNTADRTNLKLGEPTHQE